VDVSDYDGLPTPCSPYGVAVKMFNITIKSILRTPRVADCENGTANIYQCLSSTALHAKCDYGDRRCLLFGTYL